MSGNDKSRISRRMFLASGIAATGATLTGKRPRRAVASRRGGDNGLTINGVYLHYIEGRRATPIAPNAYAGYRGYTHTRRFLRITTKQGLEGVAEIWLDKEEAKKRLKPLLGKNPETLFRWENDRIAGPAEAHARTMRALYGADAAVLDLIGKAQGRPVADLLGPRHRESVRLYDGSVYMEDLLTESQREGVAFLPEKKTVDDVVKLPAYKAGWVLDQPWGIKTLKLKMGRQRWMDSFDAAVDRDIAVTNAIHEMVGDRATLFVDANNGYEEKPEAVQRYVDETRQAKLYAMEEMFPHKKVEPYKQLKQHLTDQGLDIKLADGEAGGLPKELLAEQAPDGNGPLFNIDQGDMCMRGYLWLLERGELCRKHGINLAPHNFGSEIGVYEQVHLALAIPNFEFAEGDDTRFPQYVAPGIDIQNGEATLNDRCHGLGVAHDVSQLSAPAVSLTL